MDKLFVLILFVNFSFSATHVFWYKAETNNYPITDCTDSGKGPCLPANAIISEGMIASSMVAQYSGGTHHNIQIGNGYGYYQGRCSFIWLKDFSRFNKTGDIDSAVFRVEYCDTDDPGDFTTEGLIRIKIGVANFQRNIDYWGAANDVPETALLLVGLMWQ